MSGGAFEYRDSSLKEEIFHGQFSDVFEDREISEIVWDILDLIHEFDWYASGDTCENDYLAAKQAFKLKWLNTPANDRIKRVIDDVIKDAQQELYKTYGVSLDNKHINNK